jgi:cation:H+ antiporter
MIPYVSLAAGFAILIKSADLLVKGASSVARRLKVSELAIGLTVVAFGTSTPELFVNLVASFQGNTAIAIGNILGSNVANILLILGISTLIKPLPFKPTSNLDIAVVVFSSLLLFGFMFTGKKRSLDRWEGIVFVFLYGAYVAVIAMLQ